MPSPAAHMLSGFFIASVASLKIKNNKVFLLSAFAAAAPDLDVLLVYVGIDYFDAHRTVTHSVVSILLLTTLLYIVNTLFLNRYSKSRIPYKLICVCLLCHIGMDLMGTDCIGPRGLMLFWPLSHDFFYIEINVFSSPFNGEGNIIDLSSLTILLMKEITLVSAVGLLILLVGCWLFKRTNPVAKYKNSFELNEG